MGLAKKHTVIKMKSPKESIPKIKQKIFTTAYSIPSKINTFFIVEVLQSVDLLKKFLLIIKKVSFIRLAYFLNFQNTCGGFEKVCQS